MKLGFITNCFAWAGLNDLEAMADWAIENGFTDLEIGPSIPLDRALFDRVAEKTEIRPSTFIYCRNFLDPKDGEAHLKNLTDRISFAAETGARQVVCTTGITDRIVVDGNTIRNPAWKMWCESSLPWWSWQKPKISDWPLSSVP